MPEPETLNERLMRWLLKGKTGESSKAIVSHLTGIDTKGRPGDHPHDTGDFGRCWDLLLIVPEYGKRIDELGQRSAEWAAVVAHWSELSDLYASGQDSNCNARIREILDAVPNKEGVKLKDGVTLYSGKR